MLARRFRHLPQATVLGQTVPVATTAAARLLGLALLDPGRAGPGLLLPGCCGVHTFGMRFALRLVFLDGLGAVIETREAVPQGRFAFSPGAEAVLELQAGWPPPRELGMPSIRAESSIRSP